jgi:membrane associated rhomboid family serine protease
MLPLKNLDRRHSFPAVTMILIAINATVFAYELSLPAESIQDFFMTYGLVPANLAAGFRSSGPLLGPLVSIFTSMFLHAGFLHIIGNMWFLWVFGGDVEDHLGHLAYTGLYLACGLTASITQAVLTWNSHLPGIGASGAISGIMAAFCLLFPHSRILTGLFLWWVRVRIPAFILLVWWFVIQFASGLDSVNAHGPGGHEQGGTAFWAHVGGFVAGILLALPKRLREPESAEFHPEDEPEPEAYTRHWTDTSPTNRY